MNKILGNDQCLISHGIRTYIYVNYILFSVACVFLGYFFVLGVNACDMQVRVLNENRINVEKSINIFSCEWACFVVVPRCDTTRHFLYPHTYKGTYLIFIHIERTLLYICVLNKMVPLH